MQCTHLLVEHGRLGAERAARSSMANVGASLGSSPRPQADIRMLMATSRRAPDQAAIATARARARLSTRHAREHARRPGSLPQDAIGQAVPDLKPSPPSTRSPICLRNSDRLCSSWEIAEHHKLTMRTSSSACSSPGCTATMINKRVPASRAALPLPSHRKNRARAARTNPGCAEISRRGCQA